MIKISIATILVIFNLPLFTTSNTPAPTAKVQAGGDLAASIKKGQTVYSSYCIACHQANGAGLDPAFPPLAKSDYLMADAKRAIAIVMHGKSGEITVNGKKYNGQMPDFGLNDEQITDVLNYVRNSWGNKGKAITVAEVKAVRAAKK